MAFHKRDKAALRTGRSFRACRQEIRHLQSHKFGSAELLGVVCLQMRARGATRGHITHAKTKSRPWNSLGKQRVPFSVFKGWL